VRQLGVALVAIASAGLIAVSVCVNYAFGSSFGTGLEAHIYGGAFGFADILKTAAPIAARRSFASRNWGAALIALLVWGTFTTGSAISAIGFASANRTFTVDSRKLQAAVNESRLVSLQADQSELRRLRERLAASDIGRSERQQLTAAAQRLEASIGATRGRLEDSAPVVTTPNPQAFVLANMIGLPMEKVESSLTLLVALLVEVGGLGPYIVTILAKGRDEREAALKVREVPAVNVPVRGPEPKVQTKVPEKRKPAGAVRSRDADQTFLNGRNAAAARASCGLKRREPSQAVPAAPPIVRATSASDALEKDLRMFLESRIRRDEDSALASGELLAHFNHFRRAHGLEEISQRRLGDTMANLGYRTKMRLSGGRVHYGHLAWTSDALDLAALSAGRVRKDAAQVLVN